MPERKNTGILSLNVKKIDQLIECKICRGEASWLYMLLFIILKCRHDF